MSVFLSYRREDSAGYAGRLFEHLVAVFGSGQVFMDVQDIAPGQDFAEAIERTIGACQAVVVIIGPRWVEDLKARRGGEDFVPHEISVALRRRVSVIPVLVGGSAMPAAADLPEELAPLSRRQALEIRDASFDSDVKALAASLRGLPGLRPRPDRRIPWRLGILAAAIAVMASAVLLWRSPPKVAIDGVWIAEMKKSNQPAFRVRLDLANMAGTVTGSVSYPTGNGGVQGGKLEENRLSFFTVHVPQFASEAATIRWTGVVEGGAIQFTAADDNGVARGIAHRGP